MLTASGTFAVTMGKRVITVADQLTIDLPGANMPDFDFTNVLGSISLSEQMQTDLPDAARNVGGFGTIGGQCTLTGKFRIPTVGGVVNLAKISAADFFNPDNAASPFYHQSVVGAEVTFSSGVKAPGQPIELVRKFTGVVVPGGSQIDHDAGAVTLGLGDLTTTWTTIPTTPIPITAPPYNAGLTTEYPMDELIRSQEGYSSWPALRPQCVLAVGGRSCVEPEVGAIDTTYSSPTPNFTKGAFGTAVLAPSVPANAPTSLSSLLFDPELPNGVGGSLYTEFWVTGISAGSQFSATIGSPVFTAGTPTRVSLNGVSITVTSTGITVALPGSPGVTTAYTWSTPISAGPHFVSVAWTFTSTTGTATITLDGVAQSSGTLTLNVDNRALWTFASPVPTGTAAWEAWQTTTESAPVPSYPFTPIAVLDPSLNPLDVVPPMDFDPTDPTAVLSEFQKMAAAECGYFRRDEYGIIRFSNRQTIAGQQVARTLTTLVSIKTGLTTQLASADAYDHVQIPYTDWNFKAPTAVFTLQPVKQIPRGTTTWIQTLDNVAANLDLVASVLPNNHNPADGNTWYRASADPNGVNQHPGLSITLTQLTATTVRVTIVNNHQTAWLTTDASYTDLNAGAQATGLWIGGTPVIPSDQAVVDVAYGDAVSLLVLDDNPYRQDHDAAVDLANYLLHQLSVPMRDFQDVPYVFDSRLQTMDRLQLQDPIKADVNEYVSCWGWSLDVEYPTAGQSDGSRDATISCRAIAAPGGWIGGVPGRSEGGLTTYGYG